MPKKPSKKPFDPNSYDLIEDDDPLGLNDPEDEEEYEDEPEREARRYRDDANISQGEVSSERLMSFIKRIERLEEEKQVFVEDIKDVYSEAKSTGFDVKILRKIISARKKEIEKRREEEELYELYKAAVGME
jgi:uncharacterized protein (UPF0335 family)